MLLAPFDLPMFSVVSGAWIDYKCHQKTFIKWASAFGAAGSKLVTSRVSLNRASCKGTVISLTLWGEGTVSAG